MPARCCYVSKSDTLPNRQASADLISLCSDPAAKNDNAVVFQISVYRAAATSNPPTLTDLPVVQMDSKGNQELSQISPHPSVTTVSASIAFGQPNALLGGSPNTP